MPFTLSPSTLGLFKECPRCFWLQFNRNIKRPTGIFPSLPGGMDRILKSHFDAYRDRGELPPELRTLKNTKLFDDKERLEIWRSNWKGLRYEDEQGNTVRGAVDNLIVEEEKIVVLDFKTRGAKTKEDTAHHYQHQMDIYTYLLQKNGCVTSSHAYLLFYSPSHVEPDGDVGFHTELVKVKVDVRDAEKLIRKAIDTLSGPLPDGRCPFCEWGRSLFDAEP